MTDFPEGHRHLLDAQVATLATVGADGLPQLTEVYAFADKVGAKYGGADLRAHDRPGESRVVVTIEPDRVHDVDMTRA